MKISMRWMRPKKEAMCTHRSLLIAVAAASMVIIVMGVAELLCERMLVVESLEE
jgi:hypothetical protein